MNIVKKIIYKSQVTVKNVIDSFLLYKKPMIKKSTYYRYKYVINKYIIPEFGDKGIYMLMDYDFNLFIGKLAKSLSSKTIQDIIVILKSLLRFIEIKYGLNYNLELIAVPKVSSKEVYILTQNEEETLLKKCENDVTIKSIGIIICLHTGIRLGEVCALRWKDIDLENSIINIDKTAQRIYLGKNDTKMIIDTPKSQKSRRKIPISKKLKNVLLELESKYKFDKDDFLLSHSKIKFVEPRNYQKYFRKMLTELDLPQYNFHVLRHTFATNCIKNGMDTKSLSEILGHSSVNITLNKYVHSSYEQKIKYLEML